MATYIGFGGLCFLCGNLLLSAVKLLDMQELLGSLESLLVALGQSRSKVCLIFEVFNVFQGLLGSKITSLSGLSVVVQVKVLKE